MSDPTGMHIVIPSRLGVGEPFRLKVRLLGPVRDVPPAGNFRDMKPRLMSCFNLNTARGIHFVDNCLAAWSGRLLVEGEGPLAGPAEIVFDGQNQGIYAGDVRPIGQFEGWRWTQPGMHFVRLTDPASGFSALSNPVWVTPEPPADRIFWGDPHWQTYFSDGIRCPEELYTFARDEGFLDFGAITDHMEAVTDRQWDYFQLVTNDFNEPGRFVTLQGQEWTNHDRAVGVPGHRNIYYRGAGGPVIRSTDPDCNTLPKLWACLDKLPAGEVIAIPHHSANTVMGVDWGKGWNPRYEKAVEIASIWGNSERPAAAGNPRPIPPQNLGGEKAGQHVVDALKRGYRFGFVGGGDIHDGRPGDALHNESYPPKDGWRTHVEGFTAAVVPELSREQVFDAMAEHRTYAAMGSRVYLDAEPTAAGFHVRVASERGIAAVTVVRQGEDVDEFTGGIDTRVIEGDLEMAPLGPGEFAYVRVLTAVDDHLAWSSPIWGDDR